MATVSDKHPRIIILAGLMAVLLATGCYTMFRHPRLAELNYARPASTTPCHDCHSADQLWTYTHPPRTRPATAAWAGYTDGLWFMDAPTDSTAVSR